MRFVANVTVVHVLSMQHVFRFDDGFTLVTKTYERRKLLLHSIHVVDILRKTTREQVKVSLRYQFFTLKNKINNHYDFSISILASLTSSPTTLHNVLSSFLRVKNMFLFVLVCTTIVVFTFTSSYQIVVSFDTAILVRVHLREVFFFFGVRIF